MRAPDQEAARALMARLLPAGERLSTECPLAFDERFGGELVTVAESGHVRSACAIVPREFVCHDKRVRIGLIGSVVTDPEFRRRGLMAQLLSDAEQRLRSQGCSIALLWADDPAVYSSQGFVPFGHEVDYLVDARLCALLPQLGQIRPAVAEDAHAIHELYGEHGLRVERSLDETRALLACPDMHVLVLPAAGGRELAGYACVGRGHDLTNVVHEWGGSADAVLVLIRAHQDLRVARGHEPELVLMTSAERTALHNVLESLGARRFDGILGLAKPLDPSWLASQLAAAGQRLEVGIAEGPDGARAIVAQSAQTRRELPLVRAMQALFPPGGDLGAYHYVTDALRTSLRGLPLSPFAWGLDSI